ncbi:MAG: hypothetical protein IT210_12150 [Armatimonadetes bacterium]|nr:hypothetical protein [Armatimonadota bacterium]
MKDEVILRIADETCQVLKRMEFFEPCGYVLPTYNALLQAAKSNHPEDPFLQTLSPIPVDSANGGEGAGVRQLHILMTQLRIALEAKLEESRAGSRAVRDES